MIGRLKYYATLKIYTTSKNSTGVVSKGVASSSNIFIGITESMSTERTQGGALMSVPQTQAFGHYNDLCIAKHNDEIEVNGTTYRIVGTMRNKRDGYIYLNLIANDAG